MEVKKDFSTLLRNHIRKDLNNYIMKMDSDAGPDKVFYFNRWIDKELIDVITEEKKKKEKNMVFDLILLLIVLFIAILAFIKWGDILLLKMLI